MRLEEKIIALAGDDHRIVAHCRPATQKGFSTIGLFVVVISILCVVSSYLAFWHVFNSPAIGIGLALLFSWMITNIYRLLLYTTAKDPLPHRRATHGIVLSRVTRIAFVCFIAIIVAKPIESFLYNSQLDQDITIFKEKEKRKNRENITMYYEAQIKEIQNITHGSFYGRQTIATKKQACQRAIGKADDLIEHAGLYLQRLCFLNLRHPSCWYITLGFIMVFLYPVWLKYRLRNTDYYKLKGEADKRKIDLNYYAFRKMYASFFASNYHRVVSYSEPYADAPYNTVRKKDRRRFFTQNDLISEIYDA
jgi:hypothetical protein